MAGGEKSAQAESRTDNLVKITKSGNLLNTGCFLPVTVEIGKGGQH